MYAGPIIDCDVHHDWPSPETLLDYLPRGWREFASRSKGNYVGGGGKSMLPLTASVMIPNPGGIVRSESWPPDGGLPGSSLSLMVEQLLDPFNVKKAILMFGSGQWVGAIPNPYFAAEIARASNDWCIDRWLTDQDERLYGTLILPTQTPDIAAEEIRRLGNHNRIVGVLLMSTGLGKPFGHPVYDPIHRAAAEMGLPLILHSGGEAVGGMNVAPTGSGMPSLYLEHHVLNSVQGCMTHLVSLIAHGVFEKYPTLRLVLVECGVAWLPGILWRFDSDYKALRAEVPWLTKAPSEYFHEHVRVTTQPLELSPEKDDMVRLIESFGGDDILCFASDYPHWDTDDPTYVASRLPKRWHKKVFYDNAADLFGWPAADREPSRPPEVAADAGYGG
jgi:predicted TIM-barrel fold metal-dependent hydrolase